MPTLTDALMEAVQSLPGDKQQEVLDFAEFLQARTNGPQPQPKVPLPANEISATAALFMEMNAEEDNDTPEQVEQGRRDWEAFRNAINETRSKAGARLIYP